MVARFITRMSFCASDRSLPLAGLELIPDARQRDVVRGRLEASGKKVIALGRDQIGNFAGNALELRNASRGSAGKLLVLSARAAEALTDDSGTRLNNMLVCFRLRFRPSS